MSWAAFWFADIDARQYAALRIITGTLSVIYFLELFPYVGVHFSRAGWLGDSGQIAAQNGGGWSLFFIDAGEYSELYARTLVMTGILSAFALAAGWHSRLSAFITWVSWVSFWNRNPLLLDGDDAVLKIISFYLMLAPCGHAWAIDAVGKSQGLLVPVWPLRLIQCQISLIYFVSGWVKFHSPEWQDGTVLQYVLIHPHYSRWDGWELIRHHGSQVVLMGISELIRWWELFFPVLLIYPLTRKASVAMGIFFHLGLALSMNLRWFPLVMLGLYPALLPNAWFGIFEQKIKRRIYQRFKPTQ